MLLHARLTALYKAVNWFYSFSLQIHPGITMLDQYLEHLAKLRGIESHYVDAWGGPAEIAPQSKAKLLKAMGYATDDEAALKACVQHEIEKYWNAPLPPVIVVRDEATIGFEVRVSIEDANTDFSWRLDTEQGGCFNDDFIPVDGELLGAQEIDGLEFQAYFINLEQDLPLGYHYLTLVYKGGQVPLATCRFIVAPQRAYKPAHISQGKKVWGPSVQLYCLRSERNWGIGDFTDLKDLVSEIANKGGDFVGLNPIHALYPANPESASPYSPSSRRWLNIIYIDVEHIPEYVSSEALAYVESSGFQSQLERLRQTEWVDYKGVTQAKLYTLRLVFEAFQKQCKGGDPRRRAFQAFVKAGGESLAAQAAYDALQAHLYAVGANAWGWPVWPAEYREFHMPAVKQWVGEHQDDVDFYSWLQWTADEQLCEVETLAKALGMGLGLYRDLAVGVSEGSVEIWGNGDLYCMDASVGAPPDVLGPLGQNWGLPPMNPCMLEEQAYQPMIDLFRSNMRSCGAMRIDHVMALLRLWWVPVGDDASEGAYVYYPIDDLLGILALESHRNQCLVIGEDLGTVPSGIFEILQANGIHSYRVFFFETASDGGFISPAHYPEQAMAALTTHDMATIRGYWHCDDLKLGRELGLYPDDQVLQGLYSGRHQSKQRLLDSLHGHGSIPDYISHDVNYVAMDRALNFGMQLHMARGNTALLSLQLEDWLEMDKPVNVPGTSVEYPNWRRKLSRNLSELFAEPDLQMLLTQLTEARAGVSG
jgi:4-alpha-glucanotransferase